MGTQGLCHLEHLPRGQALRGDRDLRENRPGPETEEERHWGPQQAGLERAALRGCVQTAALRRPAPSIPLALTPRCPSQQGLSRTSSHVSHARLKASSAGQARPLEALKGQALAHTCSWSPRLTLEAGPLTPRRRCSAGPPDAKPGQAAGGEGATQSLLRPESCLGHRRGLRGAPLAHLHCFGSVAGVEASTP